MIKYDSMFPQLKNYINPVLRGTHVCGSLESWRILRVCVTHSLTLEMKTRLQKVCRAMPSDFSFLHRANEILCCRGKTLLLYQPQ